MPGKVGEVTGDLEIAAVVITNSTFTVNDSAGLPSFGWPFFVPCLNIKEMIRKIN